MANNGHHLKNPLQCLVKEGVHIQHWPGSQSGKLAFLIPLSLTSYPIFEVQKLARKLRLAGRKKALSRDHREATIYPPTVPGLTPSLVQV